LRISIQSQRNLLENRISSHQIVSGSLEFVNGGSGLWVSDPLSGSNGFSVSAEKWGLGSTGVNLAHPPEDRSGIGPPSLGFRIFISLSLDLYLSLFNLSVSSLFPSLSQLSFWSLLISVSLSLSTSICFRRRRGRKNKGGWGKEKKRRKKGKKGKIRKKRNRVFVVSEGRRVTVM
jgi:hypothetical protein